jgi:tetratricopeptide (TPR) repeat protein
VQVRALALAVIWWSLAADPVAAAPKRPPASTAEARQEKLARAHFDRAEKAFNLGRFDEALTEYQSAYEALPLPAFVFNIAQCHRNLGNGDKAVFFYQRFLSLQPDAPNRSVVEELIAEQNKHLQERKAAEAATFAPPELAAEPPPAPAPVLTTAEPEPRPLDVTPPLAAPDRPRLSRRWWIAGAVGAALVGGATLLLLRGGSIMPRGQLGAIDAR